MQIHHKVFWPTCLLAGALVVAPQGAFANDVEAKPPDSAAWHPLVEIDPTDFALDGYSLALGVRPKGLEQLRARVGTFSAHFPSFLNGADNDGWNVVLRHG